MATSVSIPSQQPERTRINPWLLAATVPLAAFMELLDTTIVNVAVEHIAGDLSASIDEATYVLTSYLVANVIVLPLSGYLTGLLGRKNYYLWSVVVFTVASALCGFAPSLGLLVFFRVIQGLGGGGLQPVSQAILIDSFPAERRSTAQVVFSVVSVVAPALGPTLGGWLTDNYSWRWVFLVNIPIGILAFVLNSRLLEDPPQLARFSLRERKFDFVGLTLLAIGLGCMQVVLDRGQIDDWFGSTFISVFTILSISALVGFIWWELRFPHPVVDLRLLGNGRFALSVLAMLMMGFVFYAANYLQPLFCQQMLGWTATLAGMALSPAAIVFVAIMPIMPGLIKRVTPRYMVLFGFVVHGMACLVMVHWDLQIPFAWVLESRIFEVVGLAFLIVPINVMAFGFLAKEKVTSGSGILSLARNLGASIGVSVASTLLARRLQVHQNMLVSHFTAGDEAYRNTVEATAAYFRLHGFSKPDSVPAAVAFVGRQLYQQASMLSYIDAFYVLAIGSFLAAPIPLLVRRAKSQSASSSLKEQLEGASAH